MKIFAAFRHFNWEEHNLTPALEKFGEVIRYDWHPPYSQYMEGWHYGLKQAMNQRMLMAVGEANDQAKIDVFYGYLSGRLVFPGFIRAIRDGFGIPSMTMCLDDKTHRYSTLEPTGYAGMVDIAPAFDLCWTSDIQSVTWYNEIGAKAIYLPPGANPDIFIPEDCKRDIDVLFVGKKYGRREEIVGRLRELGIDVRAYGQGWPLGTVTTEQMVNLINRANITLGIAETADPNVISIKGRDFEVPMCGGFYLTQENPDLRRHYVVGEQIDMWSDMRELVQKLFYYQSRSEETERIRHNAARCARENHTWEMRFDEAFTALGVIEAGSHEYR